MILALAVCSIEVPTLGPVQSPATPLCHDFREKFMVYPDTCVIEEQRSKSMSCCVSASHCKYNLRA